MLERRRLGRQIVIYTRREGIFLGSIMGIEEELAFWSKFDPVGQDSAITFESIREAKRVIRSWEDKPTGIQYKQVCADITKKDGSNYASIEACFRAGLPGWDPRITGTLGIYYPRRRKRLSNKKS